MFKCLNARGLIQMHSCSSLIKGAEPPCLLWGRWPTGRHHKAVAGLRHAQAQPAGRVSQPTCGPVIHLRLPPRHRFPAPLLVAAGPMTAVQNDVVFAIVQAGVVPPQLS